MMKPTARHSLLALLSILFVSVVSAQERSHPRVARLTSAISDYFSPSAEWPYFDPNNFGEAVAIRNDVAIVGMPRINEAQGAVAIFQRTPTGWERTGTLVAGDASAGQRFGQALAFRDNTIVVGASRSAYVFKLMGGAWQQRQKLTIPDTHLGIDFPSSLVYQDNLVVAGAPSSDGTTSAVYVFELSSAGALVKRTRLLSPAGPSSDQYSNDRFGSSVAMTNRHVLVGAPGDNSDETGAAYLYARTTTGLHLQQKLVANDAQPSAAFGTSVAINDGIIAIGAPGADDEGGDYWERNGAVYLFALAPGTVTQYRKLVAPIGQAFDDGNDSEESASFGYLLALSQDRLVVAANEQTYGNFNPRGAAFSYRLSGGDAQLIGYANGFITASSLALSNRWLIVGLALEYESLGWETFGRAMIFDVGSVLCASRPSDFFYSGFESTEGWTPLTGNWSISNGAYSNANSANFVASLADKEVSACYTLHTSMFLSWTGGVANAGGYVYDYQDPYNYRELTVSRSASNRQLLTLSEVRSGTRQVVSATEGNAWRAGEWISLTLDRNQNVTSITLDNALPLEVNQARVATPSRVGLLARWNLVRFDHFNLAIRE